MIQHKSSNKKPFKYEICQQSFSDKGCVKRHQETNRHQTLLIKLNYLILKVKFINSDIQKSMLISKYS